MTNNTEFQSCNRRPSGGRPLAASSRPATPSLSTSSSSAAAAAAVSSSFLENHLLNQGSKRDSHPLALVGLAGSGPSGDV